MQGWNACFASGESSGRTNIESLLGPGASEKRRGIDVSVMVLVQLEGIGVGVGGADTVNTVKMFHHHTDVILNEPCICKAAPVSR